MKNKFLTLSTLIISTIALFSFAHKSYSEHKMNLTNGTAYNISFMSVLPHDSDEEHKVMKEDGVTQQLDIAAGETTELTIYDIDPPFDIVIYDKDAKKFHEYDFTAEDIKAAKDWTLKGEEVPVHHEKLPKGN